MVNKHSSIASILVDRIFGIGNAFDQEAFMEVTLELYCEISRVVRVAARKMGKISDDDSEDLTQDVLLKLWMGRDRIRSPKSLLALVYRIAETTRISSCRSRSSYIARLARYREMAQREALSADGQAARYEEFGELENLLTNLDARTADAVRRHFCDGQSYAAIGAALSVSNCTAHNLVQRGLSKLRAMLAPDNASGTSDAANTGLDVWPSDGEDFRRSALAISKMCDIQTSIAAEQAANPRKPRGRSCHE